jgi:hypothetical protein
MLNGIAIVIFEIKPRYCLKNKKVEWTILF